MSRYKNPRCVANLSPSADYDRICNHEMHVLGERHPSAAPNIHVFQCGYCGAVQALSDDKLDRYAERA
jgi:hypothetical protein